MFADMGTKSRSFSFVLGASKMEQIMPIKKLFLSSLTVAGLCAGGLLAISSSAQADIVCNSAGDCWHSDARYDYPDRTYVHHPDDWYFHRHWDANHWHDYHEGRGYWRDGVWVTF
jgi:hypothetical protein